MTTIVKPVKTATVTYRRANEDRYRICIRIRDSDRTYR